MKRSKALTSLSRDHHQALFVAKVIKDSGSAGEAMDAFSECWNLHGRNHFRIEEEVLLPGSGLPGPTVDDEVARMLDDHLKIRRQAARAAGGAMSHDEVRELGSLLKQHVRFEERELFIRGGIGSVRLENIPQPRTPPRARCRRPRRSGPAAVRGPIFATTTAYGVSRFQGSRLA